LDSPNERPFSCYGDGMSRKSLIYLGATIGGIVGGYLPALWGASDISGWSILLGTVGGVAGAILAYRASA
jgi:hypothetical protein